MRCITYMIILNNGLYYIGVLVVMSAIHARRQHIYKSAEPYNIFIGIILYKVGLSYYLYYYHYLIY